MNPNLSDQRFQRETTLHAEGDDLRELASGWMAENASRYPNARMMEKSNERYAIVVDPDTGFERAFQAKAHPHR